MTVTVVNIRHQLADFRCDRLSPLGNPYYMPDESKRDEVCDRYYDYFHKSLNPDHAVKGFLEYLDKILKAASKRDITIGCWCAPKRCHCDTIKEYVESEVSNYAEQERNP